MISADFIDLENKWNAHNYDPLPVVLSKGQGAWVWDIEGNRYLDMMSAYSAISHGYAHPELVRVLTRQAQNMAVCSRAFYNDQLGPLLEKLCTILGYEAALMMNSGAEGVETAIKAARRWGYQTKNIPQEQAEIIVTAGNFHGRTTTLISMSSEEKYKEGFGPLTAGFKMVPFGERAALEQAITPNTCAILTEPMQGEAGIRVPPYGWLSSIAAISKKHNVLLILDEVQTGLGRTGSWLAADHENVKADGVILGKALGGGLLPVSAFVANRALMDVFTPGSHGSTFGGSPLAAAVAKRALELLVEENLINNSARLGAYFMEKLKALSFPFIREIRGKGLWIGVDIDPEQQSARVLCEKLMKRGVLSKDTHKTVIRLCPPLVITQQEIDWALEQINSVFCEV